MKFVFSITKYSSYQFHLSYEVIYSKDDIIPKKFENYKMSTKLRTNCETKNS